MRFTLRHLGAGLLGTSVLAAGLVVGAGAASAQQTTTMTFASHPSHIISGESVSLKAKVGFAKIKHTHISGTVTFTATDGQGNAFELSCHPKDAVNIQANGKAECNIRAGELLAGNGPYTVTASYSGDTNFDAVSTQETLAPAVANTKIYLGFKPKPANGAAATLTARITAGKGTKGISSGNVTFTVFSSNGGAVTCTNSTLKGHETVPVTGHVAQCDLAAGWIRVPAGKHSATWTASAIYIGNSSYTPTVKEARAQGKVHAA
jgi:Bacterial Ig-like domain (group 3)